MESKPNGFQHPECYARALGGCSGVMSGEHYLSKSVLELVENRAGKKSKSVRITGLSFQQPGLEQQYGISSLVGNILCTTHNSLLNSIDDAGKAMFTAMDGLNDGAADQTLPTRVLLVDGDGLERWVLKSMCGGLYSGAFRVAPTETMKGVCPPDEWLHILFNGAEFPSGQGFYYMPKKPGEIVTSDQNVLKVDPLMDHEANMIGGLRVWFLGFEFALLTCSLVRGVPTKFDDAFYRPTGIRAVGSNTSVRFAWKDGARSDEITLRRLGEKELGRPTQE